MDNPSDDFLSLAATLLDALPPSGQVQDQAMLQLHALFGPMLMSALQLIDRREGEWLGARVARLSESHSLTIAKSIRCAEDPPARTTLRVLVMIMIGLRPEELIMQVTSSSGRPYTLHMSFRSTPASETESPDRPTNRGTDHPPDTTPSEGEALDAEVGQEHGDPCDNASDRVAARIAALHEEDSRAQRIAHEVWAIERMYCPCAGFMYNSLGGERNVLASDSPLPAPIPRCPVAIFYSPSRGSADETGQCKHLLAVCLAHKLGREVKADVPLPGVVGLLGLGG